MLGSHRRESVEGLWGLDKRVVTKTPGSSNRQDMRLWTVESGFKSLPRNHQQ
jgi:hypothetical protein